MQAYAEGFELMHKSEFPIELEEVAALWNRGSVVRSWLCELAENAFKAEGNDLEGIKGHVVRLRRGPLDARRRASTSRRRCRCSPPRSPRASTRAARATTPPACWPRCATSSAGTRWSGRASPRVLQRRRRGANPLTEGLERVPVPHTALVIFGATRRPGQAQAAARALQPRPRGPAARALRADRRVAQRVDRRRVPRRSPREAITEFSRREPDEDVLDALLERMRYVAVTFDDAAALREAGRRRSRRSTRRSATRSTAATTCPPRRSTSGSSRTHLKAARPATATTHVDVRCVIEKPFGTDLKSARALQATVSDAFREQPGLPDRPLPGQGDRPEHDGVPLRQLHVRAGLEPQLHRPRPDHRRRGHRHRLARRLLRRRRARCATSSRTT